MIQHQHPWLQWLKKLGQQRWLPLLLGVVMTLVVVALWHRVREESVLIQHDSLLPQEILVGGLVSAWLLAIAVDLGQRAARQAHHIRAINQHLQDEIAERKHTELDLQDSIQSLKQAEADLREMTSVMEHVVSGVAKLNLQGCYLYVNKAYADIVGYQPDDMIGMDWQRTVHPGDLERMKHAYQQMLQDGKVEIEAQGLRQDGSHFYKQVVMVAAYDKQQRVVGHYCFMKDISDRKQAEAALEQELLRSKTLFDTSIDGIVVMDHQGNVVQASPSFAQMLGYSISELLTLNVADWDVQWTDDELHHIREQRVLPPLFETRHRRKDGSVYDVEVSYSQVDVAGERMHFCICRDISGRKKAEESRRQSEEKFRLAIDFTYHWEYWQAPDGTFVYISPSCERITGYTPTEFIETPDLLYTIVHPDDRPIFDHHICEDPITGVLDFRIVTRSGETRWISHTCQPVYSNDGQYLGRRASNRDSTARMTLETLRQKAEAALRRSEATKDAIIQAIPDLLMRMRSDGSNVELISDSEFNLVNSDHFGGNSSVYEVLPQSLTELRMHYMHHALQSKTTQVYEQELTVAGNQRRYEEVRIVPLPHSEVLVMVRDITARKYSEQALRHQKEMFQAIVDHIPAMIILFDAQGRVEFMNQELERVLGWSLADWQQRDILAECYPDPSDRQQVLEHIQAATGHWQDFQTLNAQGQILETSWANVSLSDGRYLGIGQDISDRKHKEIALKHAMEAAEAANLAKSMFLANMSHELRTPLNVILGFSQIMVHDPSLTPSQHKDLQTIRRSGDHLLSLINDVLDLSKIEAGHCTVEATGFDLISLLHTLRSMMTERAKAKSLQLTFEIAPDVPQFVITDEQKLRQVLLNLLSNAVKFTRKGSVTLCVDVKSLSDSARLNPPIDAQLPLTLQFQVIDTGVGIAPDEQPLIFDAFVQAEAGKKTVSGTGLGLTISRKLLELMQGSIAVSSIPNVGSTFTVTLPVEATSGIHVQPKPQNQAVRGLAPGQPHRRILIVDDQPENRQVLVRLLTQLGMEIREATNGQEAIQQWQDWHPDLTWMDIRMPVLDGYEATKQIRAMEHGNTSIIIALTAQASQSDRTLALAAGCNDYLSKPFQEAVLFRKMAEYLGIEYLYADPLVESDAPLASPPPSPATGADVPQFTPTDLSTLPDAWHSELDKAAACCDDRAIVELVQQLPPGYQSLGDGLIALANQYEFGKILDLLHNRPSPNS